MDELDLLKKDWQKSDNSYPKLSYNDLYKMILKKSSSIVKWIFIISIIEFVFWLMISFALKDTKSMERFKEFNADAVLIPLAAVGYIILAYFFYIFFRNYRNISVTDNAKVLMENILKTRRAVRHYVGFNLGYLIVSVIVVLFIEFDQDPQIIAQVQKAAADGEVLKFYAIFILTTMLFLAIAIGILLLFYWLVYGILLGRLNKNYKELQKMEV